MKSGARLSLWPEKGEPQQPKSEGEKSATCNKITGTVSFKEMTYFLPKGTETGWGKSHLEKRKVAARFTKSCYSLDIT
jgi:hypothetical protein